MTFVPHDDIPSVAPTAPGYEFSKDVIRQARDAACSLYSRYPGAFTAGAVPGTPAETWTQGFWNDVCRKSPTPNPPPTTPPFEGGQCPVEYVVRVKQTWFNNVDPETIYEQVSFQGVTGKIQGAGWENGDHYMLDRNGNRRILGLGLDPNVVTETSFVIESIERLDGLPDECGNLPAGYVPIPLPPISDPGWNPPYLPPPGGTAPGFKITLPFGWLNPEFNLNIDVGGITLKFDLGGITFNLGDRSGDGSPGSFDGNQPDLGGLEDAINNARDAANNARDAANGARDAANNRNTNDPDDPLNDPDKQNRDPKGEDDPKEEDELERLLAVEVELTEKPKNAKNQWGDGAPDVYYAGWFEFLANGKAFNRTPIHFDLTRFNAPPGATGYAYTLYYGFKGKATVITAKPDS